jgi:serine/threonine protein kinase
MERQLNKPDVQRKISIFKALGVTEAQPLAEDILPRLLSFDPQKRWAAPALLAHPYLEEFHSEKDEPCGETIPLELFEFERRCLSVEDLQCEIFNEMLEYHPNVKAQYLAADTYDVRNVPLLPPPADGSVYGGSGDWLDHT